jgi:hypothetical protein
MRPTCIIVASNILLFLACIVVAIKTEDNNNNNNNRNIWSPVPTIFWTFDKASKANVGTTKYENSILSMDAVVERFDKELFNSNNNKARKRLIVGFLYDTLNTQECSKYIGAYHTKNSKNHIGEEIMSGAKSTLVLPYTERPSSSDNSNEISFNGMLQAKAEEKGWYVHDVAPSSLLTTTDLNKLLKQHKRVYLTIRMLSSKKIGEEASISKYSTVFKAIEHIDEYSAFITGEKSEVIPFNVGKSILIDDVAFPSTIFVEEASPRRSLADMNSEVGVEKIVAYVPSTPETMAATFIMLFLFYILWAAVGCMTAIPSAQKMFQQPPGPKDGDPQYANTVNEGKRYYPYKNLPFKEY